MNIKNILVAAVLSLGFMSVSAQETEEVTVFEPHWYLQAQVGGQHTLGEVEFQDLLSPNIQLGAGYQFHKVLGVRFSVNAWQSKAGSDFSMLNVTKDADGLVKDFSRESYSAHWKWNYVAPSVDLTVNLSNLICGYNPERVFNLGWFIGAGANIAFNNSEATDVYNTYNKEFSGNDQFLRYHWEGTKFRLTGRTGLTGDFRINERLSAGLELNANILSDRYNSKKAGDKSVDWYFNALVGVKYNLGPTHSKKTVKGCEPVIIEKIVEKPVEKIVEKVVEKPTAAAEVEPLREVVYYAIRVSDPNAEEIINKVVAWCDKYPKHGISVRGYADKGTGNPKINQGYAKKRADKIAAKLQARGIDPTRISVSSYGDLVQPFAENDKNRCVIIVGE